MNKKQLMGFAVAASLLFGFEPVAEAAPVAASPQSVYAADGLVVQVVTRAGVAHRSARRTSRRVVRRHSY